MGLPRLLSKNHNKSTFVLLKNMTDARFLWFLLCFCELAIAFVQICKSSAYYKVLLMSAKQDQCFVTSQSCLINFMQWDFATQQMLISSFPVDPVDKNYVRDVRNALFSVVYPNPLKKNPLLAAVSGKVLAEVLDINPVNINNSRFVDFARGNIILPGTKPLAHR